MARLPEGGRIGNLTALALCDANPGTRVWVNSAGCAYVAVPSGNAATNAIAGPVDPEPISWQPDGPLVTTPSGTFAASSVQAHGAAAVSAGVLDLTPTVGAAYDAEIAAGAGATTLITCPITASRRQTIGVDWNVYNESDTLAGYQTFIASRVGSAAPTVPVSAFDAAIVQTEVAWNPRVEVSGNDVLVRVTADTLNPVRAKVRAELLQSIDISDAPETTVAEVIALLGGLSGLWWRASDAVDAGGGIAASIPDAVANANTLTFSTAGGRTRPTIGTLTANSDAALIMSGLQVASAAISVGMQTSHTFICLREHVASAQIQSVSWGSGISGTPGIVAGWGSPGVFVTAGWIATGAASVVGAYECMEFWLDDAANEARLFRNGAQTGATGSYVTSVAADVSFFGCTDTTAQGELSGRVTDVIYVPSAMGASDRAELYALLKNLHASLP